MGVETFFTTLIMEILGYVSHNKNKIIFIYIYIFHKIKASSGEY